MESILANRRSNTSLEMSEFLICLGATTLGLFSLWVLGLIFMFIEHLYKRFTGQYTEQSVKLRLRKEQDSNYKINQRIETKIELSKCGIRDMDEYVDNNYNQVLEYFTRIIKRFERDVEHHLRLIAMRTDHESRIFMTMTQEQIDEYKENTLVQKKIYQDFVEQNRLTLDIFDKQFKKEEPPYYGSSDLKNWFKQRQTEYESVPLPIEVSTVDSKQKPEE